MIRALICDLDNTLFSPRSIPRSVLDPLVSAVWAANTGDGAVDEGRLQRAFEAAWIKPFDRVARQFGLPDKVRKAWTRASADLRVDCRLEVYPDVGSLRRLDMRRFLVTTGFRRFQESKIEALGVRSLFDRIFIDALDDPDRKGKAMIFRRILDRHRFPASEVLVVGDSADSEIAVGNSLGMPTVQVVRDTVERSSSARFHVDTLDELATVVALPVVP